MSSQRNPHQRASLTFRETGRGGHRGRHDSADAPPGQDHQVDPVEASADGDRRISGTTNSLFAAVGGQATSTGT